MTKKKRTYDIRLKRTGRHTLTQEIVDAFLAKLGDGSPPFVKVACERLGLNWNTVKTWIWNAENMEKPNPLAAELAEGVRRIRGEWMAKQLEFLENGVDKDSRFQANLTQWMLSKMDREMFEDGRSRPKETIADKRSVTQQQSSAVDTSPDAVRSAVEDLARPETEKLN